MNIHKITEESLKKAADILRNGGIVAFPTETVYGLGADAFNPDAVAKVFEIKNRPHFDPLIIHIASIDSLEVTADLALLNEKVRIKLFLLAENFWPGPLSIILPKNKKIPNLVTAGLSTAAIRFPDHEAAQNLISLSGGAVAAPSANLFGSLSPTKAEHVQSGIGEKADMILDDGPAKIGIESTVLDISGENVKILRPGGTPKEAIEKLIGPLQVSNDEQSVVLSPGQLKSHYAPKTALSVFSGEDLLHQPYKNEYAYLFFDGAARDNWISLQMPPENAVIKVLSESGQMLEAASRLFEILHELDNCSILRIYAQLVPSIGLGNAINDRLLRGSYNFK